MTKHLSLSAIAILTAALALPAMGQGQPDAAALISAQREGMAPLAYMDGVNAFGTISYDTAKRAFTLHSHAMGRVGDFVLKPTADGRYDLAGGGCHPTEVTLICRPHLRATKTGILQLQTNV